VTGATVQHFAEVDSTNDLALALAASGAPAGTAIVADAQRAGRGRRGRTWFSPPGAGLYLSVVLRPTAGSQLSLTTLAVGVGVARALRAETSLPIELKWPNDVVIGRPWRKLAGVLCEATGVGARVDAVIAGVGINVRTAAYPPEIADRATSIEAELGRAIDRERLAGVCVAAVMESAALLDGDGAGAILEAWREFARAGLGGALVRWLDQAETRHGTVRDIDADGALLVDAGGRVERLVAGEVQWERLSNG
jgi:BirA family biotin operon repressor/biotin-[acetyl-CoA-carboxylase] ligase